MLKFFSLWISRLIDDEQPKFASRGTFGWERYYDLHAIYSWLNQMLEQYPNSLTNYNFGTSYENRTMRAVKLSMKKVKTNRLFIKVLKINDPYLRLISGKSNHFYWVDNTRQVFIFWEKKMMYFSIKWCIFYREWASVATSTYILNELLTSSDPEIKELAENYDWVFVPVVCVKYCCVYFIQLILIMDSSPFN